MGGQHRWNDGWVYSLHVPTLLSTLMASDAQYYSGPAEVDNDWSGRTSGFYGRYFQKEAQKDYRMSSGVLLKIEVGIR